MNHGLRRSLLLTVVVVLVALVATACGSSTPTASPSASTAPTPVTSPTIAPSPTAAATASVAPSLTAAPSAAPTATPVATPSPSPVAEACPVAPQTARLPSDRLTDVAVSTSGSADMVTFTFGNMSVPEPPQGVSDGSLEAAEPPYTHAASGLPIEVLGEHVALVRFSGMSLSNDVGELTYDGPLEFRPDLAAIKTVVDYDMSEGVIGWYIGYDGKGCVTLTSDATHVVVTIDRQGS